MIVWVRVSLREPDAWVRAAKRDSDHSARAGAVGALFTPGLRRRTLVGVGLATVGLATFWGTHIYGKDVYRKAVEGAHHLAASDPHFAPLADLHLLRRAS